LPVFRQRYRRNQGGFDNRSPQQVIDMLKQVDMAKQVEEKRAALGEKATIVMTYRVNGTEPREWRWPPVPTTHQ
jgi:hypothetical protein